MALTDTSFNLPELSRWYSAAAIGALAVGATATADAQIVYTDIDDVDVMDTFPNGSPLAGLTIDFDGDGDGELLMVERGGSAYSIVLVAHDDDGPDLASGFIGSIVSAAYGYFLPLNAGTTISANASPLSTADGLPSLTFGGADPMGFQGAGDVFLGFQLSLDSGTHYGWVRINMPAGGGVYTVKDFAYESTPGTAIEAGAMPAPPPPPPPTATEPDALAEGYAFTPVAPNPVTGRSTFEVTVARTEQVRIDVVDALGRTVRTLHDGAIAGGVDKEIAFASDGLPTGIYVVRVVGESFDTTRTVSVVR